MRWLCVLAVVAAAVAASAAWGGGARVSTRCEGKPSWKYQQTYKFVEPNGNVTFTPDPAETYELVFSGYVTDPNGTTFTLLETENSVEPFEVNGQRPALARAAFWHRNHPLKDPSAVGVTIHASSDGKSLIWDGIPGEVVPLPGPHPANKPCEPDSGDARLPGSTLSLTPLTFPANHYTGTISMAVYKEVWGGESEPQAKVQANITFTGSNSIEVKTPQPDEKRVWAAVSGSVQLSTNADGQLQAVGGGGYSGVYTRPGASPGDRPTVAVRGWRFRIDSVAGPPSGGDVKLNATVTASTQTSCPTEGAALQVVLHDGEKADDSGDIIAVVGGCVQDSYSNQRSYLSHAYVTVKKVGA